MNGKKRIFVKFSFAIGLILAISGILLSFCFWINLFMEGLGWALIYISFDILIDEINNLEGDKK